MKKVFPLTAETFTVRILLLLFAVLAADHTARAQALPAAESAPISTGFALPTTLGSLQYALTASQSYNWGYYNGSGVTGSSNLTGDLAYLSNSKLHPFSMVLSGGHTFGEFGQPNYSFAGLAFSQAANIGQWNLLLSDSLNYLPGTPAAGLSGVAGVGDLGVSPVQVSGDTGQGVLTNFSNRIGNDAAASVSRQLTGKTSLNASGSYLLTRFVDGSTGSTTQSGAGLDSDGVTGQGGFSHQYSPRSGIGASYSYTSFTYPSNNFAIPAYGFASQTASAQYSYRFSRKLSINVSAGPQWSTISNVNASSISLFADLAATYVARTASSSLVFVRSTNNGFGVTAGSVSNSAFFNVNRMFDAVWNVAGNASYTQTSNLPVAGLPSFSSNTYVEGIQISRAIARSFSGFVSYTFEDQSSSGTSAIDLFSGHSQILGFGITYSPAAKRLGRQ